MTACRNRLHHLEQTLPSNIEDNPQPFVKFVLLNYSSEDEMDEWVKEELARFIPSGRLTYVHLETAEHWLHSHARNVMVRCANTDIVCNVDADNWTGPGFGKWLSNFYGRYGDKVFTGYGPPEGCPRGDYFGRISFWRKHLVALGGYNEDMNMWGAEDWDILKRAEGAGLIRHTYPKEFWIEPISHSNAERVKDSKYEMTRDAHTDMIKRHAGKFAMGNMAPNARAAWGVANVRVNWKKVARLPLGPKETLA